MSPIRALCEFLGVKVSKCLDLFPVPSLGTLVTPQIDFSV